LTALSRSKKLWRLAFAGENHDRAGNRGRRASEHFICRRRANISVSEVAISEIDSISSLRNPEGVLAIAGMPDERDAINHRTPTRRSISGKSTIPAISARYCAQLFGLILKPS
jgi:hypothetical protein